MRSLLLWKILFFISVQHAFCSLGPIVTLDGRQLGSSWTDNAKKTTDAKQIIVDNEKTTKEGKSSYNREEMGLNGRNEEKQSYGEQDRARKEYDKDRQSLGESEHSDRSKNSFQRHGSGYYKKGHHRTGFSNNYHKDESGNKSSFYEDSDDEGGRKSAENNGVSYGHRARNSFRNGLTDASLTERDRLQQGLHDNRENYDKYHDYMGGHNNNRYNGGRTNYFIDDADRYHDRDGQELYYRREHFTPLPYDRNYIGRFSDRTHYRDEYYPVDYRHHSNREDNYERDLFHPREAYHRNAYESDYLGKYGRIYGAYNGY